MTPMTREWVRKAEDDVQVARIAADKGRRLYDGIGFHCQQAAEKYLKALLQELGIDRFVDEPPRACTNAVIAALVFGPISPSMSCSPPIWAE